VRKEDTTRAAGKMTKHKRKRDGIWISICGKCTQAFVTDPFLGRAATAAAAVKNTKSIAKRHHVCVIHRPGFYVYVNSDNAFLLFPAPMSIIAPSSPLSLSRANEFPLRPTPLLKDPS